MNIEMNEIARVSGGASGHIRGDTQSMGAGSAAFATTEFRPKPNKIVSSRPAAMRSGTSSGESRSGHGHRIADTQSRGAMTAPFSAQAEAMLTTWRPIPRLLASASQSTVRKDGRSTRPPVKPNIFVSSAPIPGNRSHPAIGVAMPTNTLPGGNNSAHAEQSEGANLGSKTIGSAPPPATLSPQGSGIDQKSSETQGSPVDPAFTATTTEPPITGQLASSRKSRAASGYATPDKRQPPSTPPSRAIGSAFGQSSSDYHSMSAEGATQSPRERGGIDQNHRGTH